MVRDGTVIVDDANPLELRELLAVQKADLLVAGVEERFLAYKAWNRFLRLQPRPNHQL